MQKFFNAKWAAHAAAVVAAGSMFVFGMHLRPGQAAGHDLLRAQVAQASATAPGGPQVSMTRFDGTKPFALNTPLFQPHSVRQIDAGSDDTAPAATFQDVYTLLHRNFVDTFPPDSKLSHGAATAMLASLQDPATRFLEPDEFAEAKREMAGEFAGIGAVTDIHEVQTLKDKDDITRDKEHPSNVVYSLVLVSVLPGGPADKAGLRNGDVVTDIGDQWVASYDLVAAQAKQLKAAQEKNDPVALNKMIDVLQKRLDNGLSLAQSQTKLRATQAKPLVLTVTRAGAPAPLKATVAPGTTVAAPDVAARALPSGDGYVRLGLLDNNTASQLGTALAGLGTGTKGLVLDLRGTSGGTPEEAAAVAAKVSTLSSLGTRVGKGGQPLPIAVRPAKAINGPLVVLIDGGTEGPAELLAAALKSGGAKLVGTQTFGDDKDVRTVSLPDGSGFTMTVGQMLPPGGARFNGAGVAPDISVPASGTSDPALERAVSELSGRVARASASAA